MALRKGWWRYPLVLEISLAEELKISGRSWWTCWFRIVRYDCSMLVEVYNGRTALIKIQLVRKLAVFFCLFAI